MHGPVRVHQISLCILVKSVFGYLLIQMDPPSVPLIMFPFIELCLCMYGTIKQFLDYGSKRSFEQFIHACTRPNGFIYALAVIAGKRRDKISGRFCTALWKASAPTYIIANCGSR